MNNIRFFNATQIKFMAIILMVIDHIHQMFNGFGAPVWLTYPGRLVFPLFLFVAADSLYYTSNRKNYLRRLLFSSWSMTILSALLQSLFPNETVVLANNAFSTFFLAGFYVALGDRFMQGFKEKNWRKTSSTVLLCAIPVLSSIVPLLAVTFAENMPIQFVRTIIILSMLIPNLLMVEGGVFMVLLGVSFYYLRRWRWVQVGVLLAFSLVIFRMGSGMQWLMGLAFVPMLMYNGEKGKGRKWFFYIFYPGHIYLLYILSTVFQRLS